MGAIELTPQDTLPLIADMLGAMKQGGCRIFQLGTGVLGSLTDLLREFGGRIQCRCADGTCFEITTRCSGQGLRDLGGIGIIAREKLFWVQSFVEGELAQCPFDHLGRANEVALGKGSTVNRELGLLRRAFQLGYQQDPPLVARVPHFPKLPEGEPRKGFLKPEMYRKLLLELPEHLRLLFVIAYHVGLRRGALLRIKWSQVDREQSCIWMEGRKAWQ